MTRLCLFDLDQTLVDTDDLKDLREAGKHRGNAAYREELTIAFKKRDRDLVDFLALALMQLNGNGIKLGIFTRSPRSYVDVVLENIAFDWDVVIAYEDVERYKPDGQGIIRAMAAVGLTKASDFQDVLLVGDSDVDVRAAYHAGCRAALFKQGWPKAFERTHWNSMKLLPDLVIDNVDQLLERVSDPKPYLPDLERLLEGGNAPDKPRFDDIAKFYPDDHTRHLVYTAGRYFVGHESLNQRRSWHNLSLSILANKESIAFPAEWIETIKRFIAHHYKYIIAMPVLIGTGPELLITTIPARPGRVHRLGHMVDQLKASYGANPALNRLQLSFDNNVLAYRDGVQSQSHDHLNQDQRMANVRDHMHVANPAVVRGKRVLVIDDVSTTGATLLYAKKYLEEAGARSVDMFSLAQTISNPLRQQ